jgi:hypothetical protein
MRTKDDSNLPLQAVYLKAAGELVASEKLSINRVAIPYDENGDWLINVAGNKAVVEFNPHPHISASIQRAVVEHRREIERHGVQLEGLRNQLPDIAIAEAHLAFLQSQVDSYKVTKGDDAAQGQLDTLKRTLSQETIRLGDIPKWREDVETNIATREGEVARLEALIKEAQATILQQRKVYEFIYS